MVLSSLCQRADCEAKCPPRKIQNCEDRALQRPWGIGIPSYTHLPKERRNWFHSEYVENASSMKQSGERAKIHVLESENGHIIYAHPMVEDQQSPSWYPKFVLYHNSGCSGDTKLWWNLITQRKLMSKPVGQERLRAISYFIHISHNPGIYEIVYK